MFVVLSRSRVTLYRILALNHTQRQIGIVPVELKVDGGARDLGNLSDTGN